MATGTAPACDEVFAKSAPASGCAAARPSGGGKIVDPRGGTTPAQLSQSGPEPPRLPPILHDVIFEALTAQDMLLRSGAQEWRLRGGTWQLHRDVGAMFYAAIPPRPT